MIRTSLPPSTTRNLLLYSWTRMVLYHIFVSCLEFLGSERSDSRCCFHQACNRVQLLDAGDVGRDVHSCRSWSFLMAAIPRRRAARPRAAKGPVHLLMRDTVRCGTSARTAAGRRVGRRCRATTNHGSFAMAKKSRCFSTGTGLAARRHYNASSCFRERHCCVDSSTKFAKKHDDEAVPHFPFGLSTSQSSDAKKMEQSTMSTLPCTGRCGHCRCPRPHSKTTCASCDLRPLPGSQRGCTGHNDGDPQQRFLRR